MIRFMLSYTCSRVDAFLPLNYSSVGASFAYQHTCIGLTVHIRSPSLMCCFAFLKGNSPVLITWQLSSLSPSDVVLGNLYISIHHVTINLKLGKETCYPI